MKKKEILFVTYHNEKFEEGLSYAIYLAGTLSMDLNVLLLGNRSERFDDLMTAVTFAEAGEHKTALDYIKGPDPAFIHIRIKDECDKAGIKSSVHTRLSGSSSVVKDFLGKLSIYMVLLSPSLTRDGALLKNLVKESSHPVVTLLQESSMEAGYAK